MNATPDAGTRIAETLTRAEVAVEESGSLEGTGFWRAVDLLRRDPGLTERFADRAAALDRRAFERRVRVRLPAGAGHVVLGVGTAAGAAAMAASVEFDRLIGTLVFLGGTGAVLVASHSLAHVIVGRLLGIRFTHYFLGGPPPPRPGAKIDYATYLRTSPRRRAWMHASGAIVSKVVPFGAAWIGAGLGIQRWGVVALLALGVLQLATDALFSVRSSDWKRFRREMAAARGSRNG